MGIERVVIKAGKPTFYRPIVYRPIEAKTFGV